MAEAFLASYEKELEFRVRQGGRGLFFLSQERTRVGIANVYIAHGNRAYLSRPVVALYVAELYVIEERQRQGLGKCFLDLLIQWGLDHGASALVVEVDKDLRQANLFWNSLGFRCLAPGERNAYVSLPMRRLT
jgi:GNAT superfamily N-acetyltransferase